MNLRIHFKCRKMWIRIFPNADFFTAQKMVFSINDLFSKCDQIRRKLRIWSHLLKKSLMENTNFCALFNAVFSLKILDCVPNMRFLKHVWLTTSKIIIEHVVIINRIFFLLYITKADYFSLSSIWTLDTQLRVWNSRPMILKIRRKV